MRKRTIMILGLTLSLTLAGCDHYTQTTSGRDWLGAYPESGESKTDKDSIDARVRQAGAVEPMLRFPARIGIARIGHVGYGAGLTPLPADEAAAWSGVRDRLGAGFGEMVPLSPMIAAMVEPDSPENKMGIRLTQARRVMDTIRLAAARQHLDAVLVYEVDATADARDNPLSIADWTLIGAFVLPSQDVKAVGVAQAMLIDVRNGYPYGQVTSTADDKTESARFHRGDAEADLSERVASAAVIKLAGETEAMMRQLEPQLNALDRKKKLPSP